MYSPASICGNQIFGRTIMDIDFDLLDEEQQMADYKEYRGKCKELCEELIAKDPTLILVKGHYICPMWGKQEHWWVVDSDNQIIDPSVRQFPTKGYAAEYEPFDGTVECENCGKVVNVDNAVEIGYYMCCSDLCARRLVGL